MIWQPEWDSEFVEQSRRYTRRMNIYMACRTLLLILAPLGLAATRFFGISVQDHPYLVIFLYFCTIAVLFALEQAIWAVKRCKKRRFVFRLLETVPKLALLCFFTIIWWQIFPGHIASAIGIWWLFGILWALMRYVVIRWALKEADLQTKDYQLFGRRIGRFSKRYKHEKASLYYLPDESAFDNYAVMTSVSFEPEIYVGSEARRILESHELRTVIAHELGHSLSLHIAGFEVADWTRRIFFVPVLVSASSKLMESTSLWSEQNELIIFLMLLTLIWHLNIWASYLLGRPKESGSDLYAVEVTKTPEAFVTAMTKLSEERSYNVFPNAFDTLGFCRHPCIVKRLRRVATATIGNVQKGTRDGGRGAREKVEGISDKG